jgi:hypothetical protein
MTEPLSTPRILATLDRIGKLYPGGIPRGLIKQTISVAATPSGKKLVLLIESARELEADGRALAEAICGKGLKLPLEQCEILCFSEERLSLEGIKEIFSQFGCRAVLILGTKKPAGQFERFSDRVALWSHSLKEIASEPSKKRDFWEHLKSLIPVLA